MNIAHSRNSRSSPISTARLKIARFSRLISRVLTDEILGGRDVPLGEGLLGLGQQRPGEATHSLDRVEDVLVLRRLIAGQRDQFGDVHALVAHPLDASNDVQQRRDDPQVARDGCLTREQRQQTLMDFEIAPVDPVVVGDDHSC